jgi:hypothetical protein
VLIHSHRKLDPDVPSPAQFNQVITAVPRGDTSSGSIPRQRSHGLLLLNLRDKQPLMIPTSKPPALVTTPQNPPFPEEHEFSADGKLGRDGTFTGHIKQSYRGDTEVVLRSVFRQVSQSQWREMVQRFLSEIRRLPNGEWTQAPAEQLRHSREVKVSNPGKLSGKAQFIVEIKPGKVDSAHYLSSDDTLEPLEDKLVEAHYPLEFPPDSGAILVLRIEVHRPVTPCIAALVDPVPERR